MPTRKNQKRVNNSTKVDYMQTKRIEISSDKLLSTIEDLKKYETFNILIDIVCVDYPKKKVRMELIYLLLSITQNKRIEIITHSDCTKPIESISKIFPAAVWIEREVYDMYGVQFVNSPDMRRILTDYNFEHFPLRKDFPLSGYEEVSYSTTEEDILYSRVKLTQEYRNFDNMSPWKGPEYAIVSNQKEEKQD
ncbi:NADH-quinone oxidoreductase subunit C [Anaplasmataceae bacterium AB001_6]|nr:NADH-quinone oxidoreductase subunit C [Anaplasmataceae bacterium AB001_6]